MSNTFASHSVRTGFISAAILLLGGFALQASAFAVYSFPSGSETLYLKWGDNHAGTVGGTVYWSFMPTGTPGNAAYCMDACAGSSVDSINMEISPGGGFAPVFLTSLEPQIVSMMAQWSAVTGIQYVKLNSDSGVAINDAAAVPPATGQIRIGVFHFASGGGGVGFAPPPNGGTGAGDILLDANSFYQNYSLAEGSAYDTTHAPNDFQSLVLHELGHAIGLAHPVVDGTCPVMQPDLACAGFINRQLDPDDIAGAVFLYDRIFADGFE